MSEQFWVVQKWFSLFGKSAAYLISDIADPPKGVDWSLFRGTEDCLNVNSTKPFGAFFTPNGNFGNKNVLGEKSVRTETEAEKYIAAYYVDLDIKETEIRNVKDALTYILEVIKEKDLPVQYVVPTGGGAHIYFMVDPMQRTAAAKLGKYKEIQHILAEMFIGGDKNSHSIAKLMRIPLSSHWKTGRPIPVRLLQVEWLEDKFGIPVPQYVEVHEADDLTSPDDNQYMKPYITDIFIKNIIESITEKIEVTDTMIGWRLTLNPNSDSNVVNRIPITHILERLLKYPRVIWKTSIVFKMKGSAIYFENTDLDTGKKEIRTTMWYKINIQDNYIHNFSFENHQIMERPRGQPYPFLYHYFNQDRTLMWKFLEDEFKIQINNEDTSKLTMPVLIAANGSIIFSDKGVVYRKLVANAKGKVVATDIKLFNESIQIQWVAESNQYMKGERETAVKYYLIHRFDAFGEKELIMDFSSNRLEFNRKLGATWFIFNGGENDLLEFFHAINNAVQAGQIPKIDIKFHNWFYEDYYLLWDTFFFPNFEQKKEIPNVIVKTEKIDLQIEWRKQIVTGEFYNKLTTLFTSRIALTALSWYITVFLWQKFWEPLRDYKYNLMIPWVMMSWRTKVGKSSLISILKEGSGIGVDTRKLSVLTTSPQPLKQAATDPFLLHLDEFTGNIREDKESIIRDIINKGKSQRWSLDGTNVEYDYKASLLFDGERLPASESVVNRLIVIPMFRTDRLWSERTLSSIRWYSYLKDLLRCVYSRRPELLSLFKKSEKTLEDIGYTDRQLLLYSFLLTISNILEIGWEQERIDCFKENINILKWGTQETDELAALMAYVILERKLYPKNDKDANHSMIIELPITEDIAQSKMIDIMAIMKKYPDVQFGYNKLTIKVKNWDIEFEKRMSAFSQYFKIW